MSEAQYQVPLNRTANEVLAEGMHNFTIVDSKEGEGNAGPYWVFYCASDAKGEEGKTARLFLSLSQASRWKMELFLDAVGAPESGNVTIDRFMGKRFKGQVVHETYNGKKQANIGEMFPLNKGGTAPAASPVVVKAAEEVTKAEPETKELPKDVKSEVPEDAIPF